MVSQLKIVEATYDTPLYEALLDLRDRILRQPLGLKFTEEQFLAEKNDIHLAALNEEILVGSIVLTPLSKTKIKFRQMAIEATYRGRGFGKLLIDRAENIARDRGYCHVVLHARETAVGFYQKSGYQTIDKPFIEVTVLHRKMEKFICL
jgi:GNAT superfamily N-acetyltransferase